MTSKGAVIYRRKVTHLRPRQRKSPSINALFEKPKVSFGFQRMTIRTKSNDKFWVFLTTKGVVTFEIKKIAIAT